MAGRKRAAPGSAKKPAASSSSSRRTRASASSSNAVPDIYSQMLSEAQVDPAPAASPERPAKRRKPGERAAPPPPPPPPPKPLPPAARNRSVDVDDEEEEDDIEFEDVGLPGPPTTVQTMYRDSDEEDEDSDEEGLVFEDIDLSFPGLDAVAATPVPEASRTIELDLSARAETTKRQKTVERRKPINKSEKDRRVEIHKMHLLCLLAHVQRRNRWCNDARVQKSLRRLLDKKMVTYLNPSTELPQFGQTNSLKEGLKMVETMFKTKFQITERGMRRALWADSEEHLQNYRLPEDTDSVTEKSDFLEAAKTLQGSRDVGAQLHCALLRSAGLEARLVCSLQPLSFVSGGPSMSKPPPAKQKKTPSVEEQMARRPKYDSSFASPGITPNSAPSARRRLGHPNAAAYAVPRMAPAAPSRPPPETTPRKIREAPYPVYWVEVLDLAHQKWQPVDPLVTQSFWKPQALEPPANERDNCLAYVVGFEPDGTARDVTRRYAKAYNAKTRKLRVDGGIVSPAGERWWRRALRAYDRGYVSDLDQIETNELAAAAAREPMPRNVADFKDHPLFALERHLRRGEVLVPGARPAGTVGAGSRGPLEKIYRRRDVRLARPRDRWFRLGREVLGDAVPVKYVPRRAPRKHGDAFGNDDDGDDDAAAAAGTPLFTEEQTRLYEPPPVVDGAVPRNRFGNLEVYAPTMVPRGGAHVADERAVAAARLLGVDHAPALTGFRFEGRRGTAVLQGAVVAADHAAAVRAVAAGLRDDAADAERDRRQRAVLRAWRTLLLQLRVRQRIWAGVDDQDKEDDGKEDARGPGGRGGTTPIDVAEEDDEEQGVDGGSDEEPQQSDDSAEAGGGFIVEDDDFGGGFL